jgi:hypothetical protein
MKKIATLLFLILLIFSLSASKEKKPAPEAEVSWKKGKAGTTYSIAFDKEYKINKEAPFNFFLLDKDKSEMSKIGWELFKKENELKYVFVSDSAESFARYWFVACRYINGEIVSCKTFSNTVEIK